jgi:flagellar biogenesis protein FliO
VVVGIKPFGVIVSLVKQKKNKTKNKQQTTNNKQQLLFTFASIVAIALLVAFACQSQKKMLIFR